MTNSVVEYLDYIVEIVALGSYFSVLVVEKLPRRILTEFYSLSTYFGSILFPWGGYRDGGDGGLHCLLFWSLVIANIIISVCFFFSSYFLKKKEMIYISFTKVHCSTITEKERYQSK